MYLLYIPPPLFADYGIASTNIAHPTRTGALPNIVISILVYVWPSSPLANWRCSAPWVDYTTVMAFFTSKGVQRYALLVSNPIQQFWRGSSELPRLNCPIWQNELPTIRTIVPLEILVTNAKSLPIQAASLCRSCVAYCMFYVVQGLRE